MEVLFDTHAHLDFPQFSKDRDEVIFRARDEGVQYIVTIGAGDGLESSTRAIEIARRHDNIWAMPRSIRPGKSNSAASGSSSPLQGSLSFP
jgi:TatD DNase family protein